MNGGEHWGCHAHPAVPAELCAPQTFMARRGGTVKRAYGRVPKRNPGGGSIQKPSHQRAQRGAGCVGTDGELLPAAQGAFMEVREDRRGGKKQAMEQAMTEEMERLRRMPVQQLRARYREVYG